MRYRQIVFDVDGTLVDTEQAVICSLQDTLAQMTGQRAEAKELTFALASRGRMPCGSSRCGTSRQRWPCGTRGWRHTGI